MSKSKKTIKKVAAKKVSPKTSIKITNSMSMKTTEIRDLIDFISQTGLNEVDIETKDLKLKVKREPDQKVYKAGAPVITQAAIPAAPVAPVAAAPVAAPPAPKAEAPATSNLIEIKSPMIGTFYRTANPDSPPFVSVGDSITKGQTLCIIEAMKLFNEIESEVSGTIVKVMVENANPVEYDQVLFVIEPN